MTKDKIIEIFRAKDGVRVAEIEKNEDGKYSLWEIVRRDISPPGNRHSLIDEYLDLEAARSEASMIVVRYEQDHEDEEG